MKTIKFNEPFISGNEIQYIRDVFDIKQFSGNGKYTQRCQGFIGARLNTDVLLTDSCTSALEMSALLLKEDIYQEIILPSYTFSSTAAAFARAGFRLVFAEINPDDMMLDIDDVNKKITANTCAIVVVHYGGYCADIRRLQELCDKKQIYLVEDGAQAFDCFLEGKALGTFGQLGCISFHETKNIHAGLSGALLINDHKFFERAMHIWERGTNRQEVLKGLVDKYSWVEIGGSFYPSELQAAFLYAQLEALDRNYQERKAVFDVYRDGLIELREHGQLGFPEFPSDFKPNYHAFFIIFNSEQECDAVREFLKEQQVMAYIGYVPLHSSRVGKKMGYHENDLPLTEEYSKRVLRLPFHNNLAIQDVEYICKLIKTCLKEKCI
ncbi:MAG: dTDP-4-amino-4,6-dideoxygalactose transaminase [Syntrophomonadaceae bacterium]|nr:dTDP-4-amino-4,6-dideoxygalactose transaminase [Syntrophomonadaceae bacterium]